MANFSMSDDGAFFDDRTRRFDLVEFEGWNYTDETQVLGPRYRARSRGSYRTPNKVKGMVEFANAKSDANSEYINAVRRADQTLLGVVYNTAGNYRDALAGEWAFEDVPTTMGDQLTTSLTAMQVTPLYEPLIFTSGTDAFFPNAGITTGTAITIGTSPDFSTLGNPTIFLDISSFANPGSNPAISAALAITGATGSPWTVNARGTPFVKASS